MKRYWARFTSPGSDARPITVPAPCQWWCSGYDSSDNAIICALVESETDEPWAALEKWWPGLTSNSIEEVPSDFVPGDRFPHKDPSPNTWQPHVLPATPRTETPS